MNETVILVLAGCAGVLLGAIFFGGLWWTVQKGRFVETAGVFGSSAACCCERALPWLDSMLSPAVIGSGCWRVSLDLSSHALIVTRLTRARRSKANLPSTRRPAMRLSPDEIIFWQHGFSNSTPPLCSRGD
jgi:hypothetical protein